MCRFARLLCVCSFIDLLIHSICLLLFALLIGCGRMNWVDCKKPIKFTILYCAMLLLEKVQGRQTSRPVNNKNCCPEFANVYNIWYIYAILPLFYWLTTTTPIQWLTVIITVIIIIIIIAYPGQNSSKAVAITAVVSEHLLQLCQRISCSVSDFLQPPDSTLLLNSSLLEKTWLFLKASQSTFLTNEI